MRKSGFDAVNLFIGAHDLVRYGRLPEGKARIGAAQKKALQQVIFRVRQTYGVSLDEMRGAIYFMYAHNPLGLEDLSGYGDSAILNQVMPHYLRWKRGARELVERVGVRRAITQTIPRRTEADDYLGDMMDSLLGEA